MAMNEVPIFKSYNVSVADYFYKHYFSQSLFIAQKFADVIDNLILKKWTKDSKIHQYGQEWSVIKGNKVKYKNVHLYPEDYLSIKFDSLFLESRDAILTQLKQCDRENKAFDVNWLKNLPVISKIKTEKIMLYCT